MSLFFSRYATPLTAGLFIVSLVSGVALFFHVGTSFFREMHEILSLVLIVPFVLHLWKNWRPLLAYLNKPAFAVSMVLSLLAAGVFVYGAAAGEGKRSGPPQIALVEMMLAQTPAEVAPALGMTADTLALQLKTKGFSSANANTPLKDIGRTSGRDNFALAAALLPKAQPD